MVSLRFLVLQSSNKNKQTLNYLIEHLEEEDFKVKDKIFINLISCQSCGGSSPTNFLVGS